MRAGWPAVGAARWRLLWERWARAPSARGQCRAAGCVRARTVPGYTYVKSLGGIDEYRLDANGLTVLLAAGPLGAGGHLSGDLSRRLAQRGDRHHRRDPHARAYDVQGQRATSTIRRATASSSSWSASAGSSMPPRRSTAPITSPPSAATTWKGMSRSKPIACAICGCTRPTGKRK